MFTNKFPDFVHVYKINTQYSSPFHLEFKPRHSTSSALLEVSGAIRAGEEARATIPDLDFANAFNNVSHDILLSVLSHLMTSAEALEWFWVFIVQSWSTVKSIRIDEILACVV